MTARKDTTTDPGLTAEFSWHILGLGMLERQDAQWHWRTESTLPY